ncbi:hypothetical protein AB9K26_08785 [Psychroserpens sp. XS_ASV72]|uniref:hypothetical protein n=1 Tax=Psychroserpens sp. XS_ASV72 TaxID=3241293 RepID=UPI003513E573
MKTPFKLLVLMFITSVIANAQHQNIFSKTLDVDTNAIFKMDLRNTSVQIEESFDQKIHIEYNIAFKKHNKKEIDKIISGIQVDVFKKDGAYTLKVDSEDKMSSQVYHLESSFGVTLENIDVLFDSKTSKPKKSKEELIKKLEEELSFDNGENNRFFESLLKYKEDGTTEKVNLESLKSYKLNFVVKIPKSLELKLNLRHSQVEFGFLATNKIACESDHSTIRSHGFQNDDSWFKIERGSFKVNQILGGRFAFKDLDKVVIGTLNDAVINSEFSKFHIIEIGKNNIINDFNSEYWLYNFSEQMGRFTVNAEYSKVNAFYPEDHSNFLLKTFGYATVHYTGKARIETPPSKKKESSNMLVLGNDSDSVSNQVQINITNGIVRLGKDSIEAKS